MTTQPTTVAYRAGHAQALRCAYRTPSLCYRGPYLTGTRTDFLAGFNAGLRWAERVTGRAAS